MSAKPFAQGYYEVEGNEDAISICKTLGVDWTKALQPYENLSRLGKLTIL
jgi:hypothetical protein